MPDILLYVTCIPSGTETNLARLVSHVFTDHYLQAMWILGAGSFLISSDLFRCMDFPYCVAPTYTAICPCACFSSSFFFSLPLFCYWSACYNSLTNYSFPVLLYERIIYVKCFQLVSTAVLCKWECPFHCLSD